MLVFVVIILINILLKFNRVGNRVINTGKIDKSHQFINLVDSWIILIYNHFIKIVVCLQIVSSILIKLEAEENRIFAYTLRISKAININVYIHSWSISYWKQLILASTPSKFHKGLQCEYVVYIVDRSPRSLI